MSTDVALAVDTTLSSSSLIQNNDAAQAKAELATNIEAAKNAGEESAANASKIAALESQLAEQGGSAASDAAAKAARISELEAELTQIKDQVSAKSAELEAKNSETANFEAASKGIFQDLVYCTSGMLIANPPCKKLSF